MLDIPVCFSWRTAGNDEFCEPKALYPGTPSKCDCMNAKIPNIKVAALHPSAAPSSAPVAAPTDSPSSMPIEIEAEIVTDPFNPGEPRIGDKCLQDNAPELDLVCASEDVTIDTVTASAEAQCIAGQTIIVTLEGSITLANGVTDPFWYVASDGGDALGGSCVPGYLQDGTTYSFTNDASISYSGNSCGDVVVADGGSTTLTNVPLMVAKAIPCVDENADGKLDVSICMSWNDVSQVDCGVPGDATSCACATYDIPNISVTTSETIKACT